MNTERKNSRDHDGVLVKKLGPRKGHWPLGKIPFSVAIDTKRGVAYLSGDFRSVGSAHRAGKKFANK